MNEPGVDLTIRQAIGGDGDAIARIRGRAPSTDDARVIVMAALLDNDLAHLVSAGALAVNSRDRQIVEIARASFGPERARRCPRPRPPGRSSGQPDRRLDRVQRRCYSLFKRA